VTTWRHVTQSWFLREARLAEEHIASKLVNELLHDLGSLRESNADRARAPRAGSDIHTLARAQP
jgi:hypothetical protein